MIYLNRIYERVRLSVADSQKTKYSDYEIQQAVSHAVDLLLDALVHQRSRILSKSALLVLQNGEAPFPSDYYALNDLRDVYGHSLSYSSVSSFGSYRIEGTTLRVSNYDGDGVALIYFARPNVGAVNGVPFIDLPELLTAKLSLISVAVLSGENEKAESLAETAAMTTRNINVGNVPLPPLWGGYNP